MRLPGRTASGALLLASLIGALPAAARPRGAMPAAARPRSGPDTARARAHAPAPRRLRAGAMATIPTGSYRPLYGTGRVQVGAFELDRYPVTRGQYAAFLRLHPEWRRSRAARSLVGAGYLSSWQGDLEFGPDADAARPVTRVSRAAAAAYCAAQGKRLPTVDEWEYAAAAGPDRRDASGDPAFRQRLLELYTRPRPGQPAPVASTFRNAFGVWDLHGLVWEWTAVAHAAPTQHAMTDHGHDRGAHHGHDSSRHHDMGCAASAAGASDTRDYAAFLRYAFRTGLTPTTTLASLGFRCAR